MKKYRLKQCDMTVDELKIKALLEGLEAENIEEFMREAKVDDYRNYGKVYCSSVSGIAKENAELRSIISELRQIYFFNINPETLKVEIRISKVMELWERVNSVLKERIEK